MNLEFVVPDGEWSAEYGKQVGLCATRNNINVKEYPKLDGEIKKGFQEETKGPTPCRDSIEDKISGNKVVVADGMVHPFNGVLVQDNVSWRSNHYKVQIDSVYTGHEDDTLPIPTGDGFTNLGGVVGSFVQWPTYLVLFEEEVTPCPKKKSKSR